MMRIWLSGSVIKYCAAQLRQVAIQDLSAILTRRQRPMHNYKQLGCNGSAAMASAERCSNSKNCPLRLTSKLLERCDLFMKQLL